MNATPTRFAETLQHPWRPLFWEPVSGTGERIMVGVLHSYNGNVGATRLIRDDVLDSLYGKSSIGVINLIDKALELLVSRATNCQIDAIRNEIFGIYPGPLRLTAAKTKTDLLKTAALLYSSLANIDKLDEEEDTDSPQEEYVSKRFSGQVKLIALQSCPNLYDGFGMSGPLVDGGEHVKFGYFSPKAIIHFTVLNIVRQPAGVRDARARIFELQRAREVAGVGNSALIASVPRIEDPTLTSNQRERLMRNLAEIESEADSVDLRWYSVNSPREGADQVIALAG